MNATDLNPSSMSDERMSDDSSSGSTIPPARRDKYDKLWFALVVLALIIGGAVAFKYVMFGVLVVAAIMAIIVFFWRPGQVLHEYVMLGVLFAGVIAGMAVYIGNMIHNGLKVMIHTYDPAPDVIFVVDPAVSNIVELAGGVAGEDNS